MKDQKCNRCGLCCISAPCFKIGFKQEVKVDGLHECPNLEYSKEGFNCKIFGGETGLCTSRSRGSYETNVKLLARRDRYIKESTTEI